MFRRTGPTLLSYNSTYAPFDRQQAPYHAHHECASAWATQAACDISEQDVNTQCAEYATTGMAHTEGGWPKEVDIAEAESVVRYRKKVCC